MLMTEAKKKKKANYDKKMEGIILTQEGATYLQIEIDLSCCESLTFWSMSDYPLQNFQFPESRI